ncbi:MAG TPA: HD domain-containing protein [Pirellulales bacterium]|nr:HD domain-containing protein [Pirellulales bacterium]
MSPRFNQALVFAAELHADQRRKGSATPYIAHLLAVAALVLEYGGNEDEAIAALLHDAVEDQGGAATGEAIRGRFGEDVYQMVAGCSDTEIVPKPPWRERKEQHLAHLASASESVRHVVAADKLHNVRALIADYRQAGETLWARFNGGRAGTLWFYRAMADVLRRAGSNPLVAELERAVAELERLVASGAAV